MNPPQPPQPHRPSTSCHRHPDEPFTGFCPSCLCERLALLDPNNNPSSSSSSTARKPPSAAASALKALFRPELRRTKSFSASKNEPFNTSSFEPQRKSCDVRVRNTLSTLFHTQNDNPPRVLVQEPEEQKQQQEQQEEENRDDTRTLEEEPKSNVNEIEELEEEKDQLEEEEEEEEELVAIVEEEELKTMKDHIDLDSSHAKQKARDFKDIAGSFFSAASVFSKKLQKWRQKQKAKKRRGGGGGGALPVEKPIGRQFRDTQSEIADYGFGRRSCDTDPRFSLDAGRFSLDAGRVSFDDPRYSLDEPRASWDGYLVGRTGFPRMPTMLSVVEDAPVVPPPPVHHVVRTDMQIPVEEPPIEDDGVPGGSAQTREYYSDSSSRRRKSLDRSSSARKSVSLEVDELSNGSGGLNVNVNVNGNGKVAPAGVDYVQQGVRMGFNDREFDRSSSLREDCCSEKMFDVGVIGDGNGKGEKKGRRWRWSIWGFIHRRGGGNKDEDDDRYSRVNGVERSYSESWGGDNRGGVGGGFNGRVLRSNSSVSWRNAQGIGNGGGGGGGGGFGGFRRNGVQGNNGNGKKGKDEFVLERNRSARYSPNNIDNGLLRFYLTPMRGSRRNGSVKTRSNQAHSIARSVLGLY